MLEMQAEVIRDAVALPEEIQQSFMQRLTLTGAGGALGTVKSAAHRVVADWGGASDALAKVRLGNLCALVRDKAGGAGQGNNLIDRVEVLARRRALSNTGRFPGCGRGHPATGSAEAPGTDL